MKLVHFNVLAILGVFTSACYGCETNPTYPTPISVAGSPGAAGAAASAAGNPSGGAIGLAGVAGTGGGGAGGSSSSGGSGGSAGPCALACARLTSLGCDAAKPSEGVTCEALCEEIPTLKASAPCVVRATSCSRADACSSEAAP